MIVKKQKGVPKFEVEVLREKRCNYCLLIPIINEGDRIIRELQTAKYNNIGSCVDIIICDGGSTDGCTELQRLKELDVNTLLTKLDTGKQGAQLRMCIYYALKKGYQGIITINGNNKDSIEDDPKLVAE